MKKLKKELKDLVVTSKDKLFDKVNSSLKNDSLLKDDFKLIKARHYNLIRDFNLNIISRENYDIEQAKITKSLIDMINLIKDEDLINTAKLLKEEGSKINNLLLSVLLIISLIVIIFQITSSKSNSNNNMQESNFDIDSNQVKLVEDKTEEKFNSIFETPMKNLIIFAGARGIEYAHESKEWEGGLFTYFLSKGISGLADVDSNNIITIRELFDYVTENVSKTSNGLQNPTLRFVHGNINHSIKGRRISETYCLSIGVSKHYDSSLNLQYSSNDAKKFGQSIQNFVSNSQVHILTDESATKNKIEEKLNLIANSSSHRDLVYIYYNGHGVLDSDFEYYLVPHNFESRNVENGISYSSLENILSRISAYQIIMILDSCHSGELDKEELQKTIKLNKGKEIKFR